MIHEKKKTRLRKSHASVPLRVCPYFSVRLLLVAEDLLEPGGGKDEVAEGVDVGTRLQHHRGAVPLHLVADTHTHAQLENTDHKHADIVKVWVIRYR